MNKAISFFSTVLALMTAGTAAQGAIEDYRPILVCDGGAAVLGADPKSPSNLLLTIHDSQVAQFLTQFPPNGKPVHLSGRTTLGIDFDSPSGPKLKDVMGHPVRRPEDFSYMIINGLGRSDAGSASLFTTPRIYIGRPVSVYRHRGGLKVEILEFKEHGCTGPVEHRVYFRDGQRYTMPICHGEIRTSMISEKNWFFQSCQKIR